MVLRKWSLIGRERCWLKKSTKLSSCRVVLKEVCDISIYPVFETVSLLTVFFGIRHFGEIFPVIFYMMVLASVVKTSEIMRCVFDTLIASLFVACF